MNNAKLRLEVVSPTTIKCGHIEWFALDTKLVGKVKALLEENNEWSMIFYTFSKRPYAHKYLEEKKKELGNKNIIGLDSEMIYKDYYDLKKEHEKCTRKHWQSKCAKYSIKNKLLQNRIDKAIEYIEDNTYYKTHKGNINLDDVIIILRGEAKENNNE